MRGGPFRGTDGSGGAPAQPLPGQHGPHAMQSLHRGAGKGAPRQGRKRPRRRAGRGRRQLRHAGPLAEHVQGTCRPGSPGPVRPPGLCRPYTLAVETRRTWTSPGRGEDLWTEKGRSGVSGRSTVLSTRKNGSARHGNLSRRQGLHRGGQFCSVLSAGSRGGTLPVHRKRVLRRRGPVPIPLPGFIWIPWTFLPFRPGQRSGTSGLLPLGEGKDPRGVFLHLTRSNPGPTASSGKTSTGLPLHGLDGGIGTAVLPSIEDKVIKFPEKESHLIFLEPVSRETGRSTCRISPRAFPTMYSLPWSIPFRVRLCHITRPGTPRVRLRHPHPAPPLFGDKEGGRAFLRRQITARRGTRRPPPGAPGGHQRRPEIQGEEPVVLSRSEAYLGVLVDDLVTKERRNPTGCSPAGANTGCSCAMTMPTEGSPIGRKIGLIGKNGGMSSLPGGSGRY